MNKSVLYILLLTVFPFFLSGCKKKVRPTTMVIKDSVRHYYPIKQGQQLDIMFTITNTGDAPLVISDIQPSCGCIILDKSSHIIIPEVVHRIRIFGNMLPNGKAELTFDVNVVPDADYTRDYEELFQEFNAKNGIVKEMVDGKESELGYYVGTP